MTEDQGIVTPTADALHAIADWLWQVGKTDAELDAVGVLRDRAAKLCTPVAKTLAVGDVVKTHKRRDLTGVVLERRPARGKDGALVEWTNEKGNSITALHPLSDLHRVAG